MKKTRKIRFLAFILTLCMMIGVLPLYVFADGTEAELPEQITETTNENLTAFQLGLGEKSVAELENMTLSAADIPASISRETVEAKDHVLRLREQEADLNTVIFQNRDGGKTVYLFGSPVKYVDANGNIRDKSTTLVSENVTVNGKIYAHSATDNFFGQYYPTMPQNGVMLAFGPYTVEMKPVITGVLTLRDTVVADNKVTYNKVFGTGTSLVYTPTLNGVKEDIILQTYTGKSSFSFTLKTNGLAIIQDENDTFLADFEGKKVASLGDVIITDKVGKTAYGTMTVVTKIEREEYTVTVNAPMAFLASATTVYPVTVDPTLSIYDNNTFMDDYGNNLDIIHDMCVYQNGSASAPISTIGSFFYNEDSCEWEESARMLYRLNPYYFSSSDSPLLYMASPRFESASLFTTVSLGQESSVTVDIYPYNAMWSYEENVYGDPIYSNGTTADYTSNPDYNNLIGSVCASTTVYYTEPMETEFDITPIVNYWTSCNNDMAYDNNPAYEYGFIMMLTQEHENIEKLSVWQSEYSGTSVYIAIDYNNLSGSYYVNSCDTGKFLTGSSTSPVTQSTYGREAFQGWTFTYKGNNLYEITLTANSNRILYMDSSYNVAIGTRSSLNSANYTWQLTFYYNYVTIRNQGTGKYLYAPEGGTSLGGTSSVSLAHWRMCKTSAYVPITGFSIADIVVNVGETVTPTITMTPSNATWASASDFTFCSTNSSVVSIINNTINPFGIDTFNIVAIHNPTGTICNFELEILPILIYRTRNRERLGFADPQNSSDITPIESEDLSYGKKSTNTLISNGTYISLTDLYYNIIDQNPISLSDRKSMINTYCLEKIDNVKLSTVFTSMMNHFVAGSGDNFYSEDLTNAIVSHPNTSEYTQGVISILKEYLNSSSGNITGLYYDEDLWTQPLVRKNHYMVNAMSSAELYEPCYDAYCGEAGLMLCVDSLYGNKFEIESYELNGTNYSGVLKFTFYDHFGLDTNDMQSDKGLGLSPGYIEAFRQWYILQHWDSLGYTSQPKPFVTIIEFSVPFSGNLSD